VSAANLTVCASGLTEGWVNHLLQSITRSPCGLYVRLRANRKKKIIMTVGFQKSGLELCFVTKKTPLKSKVDLGP